MKFSVIMPCWNRKERIQQAIGSVLAQTRTDFELVIADDGSEDGTPAMLREKYGDEIASGKIILLEAPHAGVCAARNLALSRARGEWITYVDSDNTIRPDFLEIIDGMITLHPEYRTFNGKFQRLSSGEICGGSYDREALLRQNYIDMGCFVHHRSLYEELGGFDTAMRRLVDWELILRYTEKYPPGFIDAVLLDYNDECREDRVSRMVPREEWRQYIYRRHAGHWPLISTLILPAGNPKFLPGAVKSAMRQKGAFRHEILIADAGYPEETGTIAAELAAANPRLIRLIPWRKEGGIPAAAAAADGEFAALLNSCDSWEDREKLQRQLEFLQMHPECPAVYTAAASDGGTGQPVWPPCLPDAKLPECFTGREIFNAGSTAILPGRSTALYRRELLQRLPAGKSWDHLSLTMAAERQGPIGYLETPTTVCRVSPNPDPDKRIIRLKHAAAVCAPEYRPDLRREILFLRNMLALRRKYTEKSAELKNAGEKLRQSAAELKEAKGKLRQSAAELKEAKGKLRQNAAELKQLKQSASYRLGRLLTALPRKLKKLLRK